MADDEEYGNNDENEEEEDDDLEFAEDDVEPDGDADAEDDKEPIKPEEEYEEDHDDDDDVNEYKRLLAQKLKQEQHTFNHMTKYEVAALIGLRAQQISEGCPVFIEVPEGMKDPSKIAEEELRKGKLPLMLERPLPARKLASFYYETRTLNELANVIPPM